MSAAQRAAHQGGEVTTSATEARLQRQQSSRVLCTDSVQHAADCSVKLGIVLRRLGVATADAAVSAGVTPCQ
eukprot:CAMPEP_0171184890 /NCGR_PEP_ID=MMETSP0790-20130122/16016_1 /TAXON_ID=2925 /ORGANISM="Alexandrium catenella, Strain OF101" /LENGTH=71 /DNA_ID=CAMNT_0011649889 /DNA_START=1265 /DNA_END=1479 /DNA_ORIENTATION=-